MKLRPTPCEERQLTLARRLRRNPRELPFSDHTGGWRTAGLPTRCTFFVLGLVAAGMLEIITEQLEPAGALVTAGIASIAVAEWLILSRRHFWSGIEEALGAAGFIMLALECWSRAGWSESAGAWFVCAGFTITGLRLLNPLFTTLATLAFVQALGASPLASGLVCYGIGAAALIAGGYRFRRPSHDLMLSWLVVVMPIAGYLWSVSDPSLSMVRDYLHATPSAWIVPLCPLAFSGVALAVGLLRRVHAPIVAFMLCVTCTAYELRGLTGFALETRLIVWGCVLLLVSIILDRYLREARGGVTSRKVSDRDEWARILAIGGSAVLTPHSPSKSAPSFEGGGGSFGGGGATDRY